MSPAARTQFFQSLYAEQHKMTDFEAFHQPFHALHPVAAHKTPPTAHWVSHLTCKTCILMPLCITCDVKILDVDPVRDRGLHDLHTERHPLSLGARFENEKIEASNFTVADILETVKESDYPAESRVWRSRSVNMWGSSSHERDREGCSHESAVHQDESCS